MRELQDREKRDNVQSLFDVKGVPSDNQIRNIVDEIEPSALKAVFNQTLKEAQRSGVIDEYRILDGGVLIAIDGVWYFSSENINCHDKRMNTFPNEFLSNTQCLVLSDSHKAV